MFESADLDHTISKATYRREEPKLREALLQAQMRLGEHSRFPLLIIIGGVDGAGKGETVNLLNEWMDPRHIRTHAFGEPSDEECERPYMWRYWRALPPKGKIGVFFGSWYTTPIVRRALRRCNAAELDTRIAEILRHERMLVDEGTLLLKFWFHLSKSQQRDRFHVLENDPKTAWRVTREEWRHFKHYDRFRKISEHTLRETSSADAPWVVVPGADHRYRSLTAGRILLDALEKRLREARHARPHIVAAPTFPELENIKLLGDLDLKQRLPKPRYEKQLEKLQGELNLLSRSRKFRERSLVAVFEGWDAAGKGSAIRRVAAALDARHYQIIPIAAPTDAERAQPYLWRFWRHLPRAGRFAIFDRSWYGRVLVERVEGFCKPNDWMRAYSEINDFERQLAENGSIVAKLWLHISKEEQYRRFKARQKTAFKRFKITPDDWRNRKQRQSYEAAVCDMVERTSSDIAPWTLVEAEDKCFARIKVLRTLIEAMENEL